MPTPLPKSAVPVAKSLKNVANDANRDTAFDFVTNLDRLSKRNKTWFVIVAAAAGGSITFAQKFARIKGIDVDPYLLQLAAGAGKTVALVGGATRMAFIVLLKFALTTAFKVAWSVGSTLLARYTAEKILNAYKKKGRG